MSESCRPAVAHSLNFECREIPILVRFSERSQLSISVHPDLRVVVTAPASRPDEEVLKHVRRKTAWIAKQISYFEQFHPLPTPKRYVSGETYRYLGRQHRLRVVEAAQAGVKLAGPFLIVAAKSGAAGSVKRLVDSWYRERAREVLPRYVERCLLASRSLGLVQPRIVVRKLDRRWGSCTKAGTIVLNTDLVMVPAYCIEYVIMHELCHLQVHDHSARFFDLLSRFMPDWKRRKRRLDLFIE